MEKLFVLDTSVLLQDPNSIFAFEENELVIPAIVLEEIDSKKRQADELGRNARQISRTLDGLRKKGRLDKGVTLENGGTLRIELNHKHITCIQGAFHEINNDNRILAVALNLFEEEQKKQLPRKVYLVSKDALMRIKADILGIPAQDYLSDMVVKQNDLYPGFETIEVDPSIIDTFYTNKSLDISTEPLSRHQIYPHKFFILKDQLGSSKSAVAYYNPEKNLLEPLWIPDKDIWGIYPRNIQQKMAMQLLLCDNIPLVTLTGRAGTGKTLLALAAGLYKTEELGLFKKLLVARPIVPMGRELGFLPGDKEEKLRPWMQPIFDNMEFLFGTHKDGRLDDILAGLKRVEVEALTYIRGRTLPNQFIIIDEAQNLTKHEVKTIVSRVGEGSKIVLVGDPEQIDHPYMDFTSNGLTYLVEKFKEQSISAHVNLEKGERSALAQLASQIL
ncbi:PhoH family protein [Desulfitibacter alkalitolerans]|uniref:PhoH family protein n=1 Tax=Desulfitibacter alkalitolerans TaxID=264641 RepID=UPI000487109B|nr:PhoH family protein [Desulfitibacter alkalitolerans]